MSDGNGDSASLNFNSSYTLSNLKLASDDNGGTIVYDAPTAPDAPVADATMPAFGGGSQNDTSSESLDSSSFGNASQAGMGAADSDIRPDRLIMAHSDQAESVTASDRTSFSDGAQAGSPQTGSDVSSASLSQDTANQAGGDVASLSGAAQAGSPQMAIFGLSGVGSQTLAGSNSMNNPGQPPVFGMAGQQGLFVNHMASMSNDKPFASSPAPLVAQAMPIAGTASLSSPLSDQHHA